MGAILPLGSEVNRNGWRGTIQAVGYVGERYYWLQLKDGSIAMVPATDLEEEQRNEKEA